MHEIESESITPELLEHVDDQQVVIDLDEIVPSLVHTFKAKDVFEYYELTE